MWMLHSPNMQQSYKMWKKAVWHITLAKLNPSLTSAWPPQMLISEYYKKKRQSVNRKPRSGLTRCTKLFYSRFSTVKNSWRACHPSASDLLEVFTAVVCMNPKLGHPTLPSVPAARKVMSASNSPPLVSILRMLLNECTEFYRSFVMGERTVWTMLRSMSVSNTGGCHYHCVCSSHHVWGLK